MTLVDLAGIGGNSLKSSSWILFVALVMIQGGIMGACFGIYSMHITSGLYFLTFPMVWRMVIPWFAVINWAMFAVCMSWGFVALSIPVRPRAPKQKALLLFVVLLLLYTATHIVWIAMFCKRCHNFYMNSLVGNILKETVETVSEKLAKNEFVETALYVLVSILNWAATPEVYLMYRDHLPPFHLLFWAGWNWSITAFVLGVIPVAVNIIAIVVVLGYKSAVDCGGDGNEGVMPSRLPFFYSLSFRERSDIRKGACTIDDMELSDDESSEYESSNFESKSQSPSPDSEEGSGGTKSSGQDVQRIPSYKPNRSKKRMVV